MGVRSGFAAAAALVTVTACAAGEPIDGAHRPLRLGDTVEGLLFIEVEDAGGVPLGAEAVWVSSDGAEPQKAECLEVPRPLCTVWHHQFEAGSTLRAAAEICGDTFEDHIDLFAGVEPDFARHLTIVAGCD